MPPQSSGLFGSIAYGMSEVGKIKVRLPTSVALQQQRDECSSPTPMTIEVERSFYNLGNSTMTSHEKTASHA
ncbi:hypothetical protein LOK49_LG07G01514 [Camellia lanceoleosa]|uniref:Uncharacterized protein n=1 Tax=Camellia lanceoleosa TaxID=1840588 RepID=A0ACC0H582_9ERIC|nr:hypothetical protein LOK49_LG07G01514 [Camellia lanceoleosa]